LVCFTFPYNFTVTEKRERSGSLTKARTGAGDWGGVITGLRLIVFCNVRKGGGRMTRSLTPYSVGGGSHRFFFSGGEGEGGKETLTFICMG